MAEQAFAARKLGANNRAGTHPCEKRRGADPEKTRATAKTKNQGERFGKKVNAYSESPQFLLVREWGYCKKNVKQT